MFGRDVLEELFQFSKNASKNIVVDIAEYFPTQILLAFPLHYDALLAYSAYGIYTARKLQSSIECGEQFRHKSDLLGKYPTEHVPILEGKIPSIYISEQHKIRRLTDFEALKLGKVRSEL